MTTGNPFKTTYQQRRFQRLMRCAQTLWPGFDQLTIRILQEALILAFAQVDRRQGMGRDREGWTSRAALVHDCYCYVISEAHISDDPDPRIDPLSGHPIDHLTMPSPPNTSHD